MSAVVHSLADGLGEDLTQRCVFCGEIIVDYRNAGVMLNDDGSTPEMRGFPAGPVTVRKIGPVTGTSIGAADDAMHCSEIMDVEPRVGRTYTIEPTDFGPDVADGWDRDLNTNDEEC